MLNNILYYFCWYTLHILQKYYNICKIKNIDNNIICIKRNDNNQLYCHGCNHLTNKGCNIKSLYCKLWFCEEILSDEIIINKYKIYFYIFSKLYKLINKYNLPLNFREK